MQGHVPSWLDEGVNGATPTLLWEGRREPSDLGTLVPVSSTPPLGGGWSGRQKDAAELLSPRHSFKTNTSPSACIPSYEFVADECLGLFESARHLLSPESSCYIAHQRLAKDAATACLSACEPRRRHLQDPRHWDFEEGSGESQPCTFAQDPRPVT